MEIQNLKVSEICPSPMNPRKTFDKEAIKELAANIKEQGLLQPITVRPCTDDGGPSNVRLSKKGEAVDVKYEIVCGERRFRAVKLLGQETIAAIVREMTDEEAFDAMITENLQRKDVDPIEECLAYNTLLERGQTAEDIAARMGKSVRYVQDRTRLRSLIKKLHKPLKDGLIPLKGAILLAKCSEEVQEKFVEDELDDEGEQTMSFSDIKDFVDDDFMLLERAPWIGEDKDDSEAWTSEGVACKQCLKNTANHGCLFYEMKGDAKCTDRECFEQKKMLYRKSLIRALGDSVVKKGEDITPGKVLIVTETCPSWKDADYKKRLSDMEQWAKDAGYELVDIFKLGGRCWYSEDDKRTQKMLAEGKVIRTALVWSDYSRKWDGLYYIDKKASEVSGRDEKDVLLEQYKSVVRKNADAFGEAVVKKLKEVDYKSMTDPIDSVEETILNLILLDIAGYVYLNENDIKWGADNWIRFISEHPEKKDELRRRAIAEFCGRYNQSDVAKMLLRDRYKEAFEELERSNEQSIAKKTKKIVEQLAALGFNPDGSPIEQ